MRLNVLCVAGFVCFLAGVAQAQNEAPGPAEPPPAAAAEAPNQGGRISVELNKLEPADNACRGYFVVGNDRPDPLKELQIEVVLFDQEGVVMRQVLLTFAGVRAGRTKVVLFDLPDLDCGDIGRLLLNEVLACTSADGSTIAGCGDLLAVSTRAAPAFEY